MIKEVDVKVFDEYVLRSKKPHFMQSSAWGEVNEARGNAKAHCLLVEQNGKTIGSALLIEKKLFNYSSFYCPRGFLCDYQNKEELKQVVTELKEYVKNHGGIYLKVDPDIIIRKLDKDGNTIEESSENLALISEFEKLDGKHRGFTTKFSDSSCPRYTFRLDVTKDNLLDTFHQTTRNILRRNNPYHLDVFVGNQSNLNDFYEPMKETAIRKHMYVEDKKFFDDFYNILHAHNMSDLYVVKVNIPKLKETYNSLILNCSKELEEIKDSNKKGRINDLQDQLNKYNKELKQIEAIQKDDVVLSSMITVKYNNTVWTLHGANANELSFLNANYEMYYKIIEDARNQGYTYVDFYGSEGVAEKHSDAYGIYQFKVRFSGDFDEFIGEFDFVTRPLANKIILGALKQRRKIKYRLQQKLVK